MTASDAKRGEPATWPRDVFILGAGFSRAVSSTMPLTQDLYTLCTAVIRATRRERGHDDLLLDAYGRFDNDLETWLTWLAGAHPWLDEATYLRNRAAFLDIAVALAQVIVEAQNATIRSSIDNPPTWLHALVDAWANRGATVITLNYDALVEKTYETVVQTKSIALYTFSPEPLQGSRWNGVSNYRFDLLKLHGSITWYVHPSESSQPLGPVYDAALNRGWACPDDQAALRNRAGGRRPLLVPPVLGKDPFFDRPELRDQWLRADECIREAERLFLLGYSLPQADLAIRFLLDRAPQRCIVYPVNPDPRVKERVARVLSPRDIDSRFSGRDDTIRELADAYSELPARL
jgi:hypothetical protein